MTWPVSLRLAQGADGLARTYHFATRFELAYILLCLTRTGTAADAARAHSRSRTLAGPGSLTRLTRLIGQGAPRSLARSCIALWCSVRSASRSADYDTSVAVMVIAAAIVAINKVHCSVHDMHPLAGAVSTTLCLPFALMTMYDV